MLSIEDVIMEWLVDNELLCDYCDWWIDSGGSMNTSPMNMCEGRNCENAVDIYIEEGDLD